jgi:hypothetical protein
VTALSVSESIGYLLDSSCSVRSVPHYPRRARSFSIAAIWAHYAVRFPF